MMGPNDGLRIQDMKGRIINMQIIKTEIGRANSPYFGEVVCLADDSGNPCFWAKKLITDFLNLEKEELIIALDILL